MSQASNAATRPDANELVITRIYEAPAELIFDAWTSPAGLARWMGPAGFTAPSVDIDLRKGGSYVIVISSPKDGDHGMRGSYREIVRPRRLVFTFRWDDAPAEEPDTLVTLTFTALGNGQTQMEFRQSPFDTPENRDGHDSGWNEAFDKLGTYLATT